MAEVAVFHPNLTSRGGGESVCMNVLEALQSRHELTLFTIRDANLNALNQYYNTEVEDVEVDHLGLLGRTLDSLADIAYRAGDVTFGRLQSAVLNRFLDRRGYDLVVSTYNEFSFATPAVQYVHYPNFGVERERLVYRFYDRLCNAVDGFDAEQIRTSTLLANSEWTADIVEEIYGTRPGVLYPPVDTTGFETDGWTARENGFVTVGRVEPSKRVLRSIDIVSRLRDRGHDVHLHVVGPVAHSGYAERVREAASERQFVSLEGAVSRERLVDLVCSHRYGIHGKDCEHFGMAVAELVAGGTVPFVPDSGGQREIVDGRSELLYSDADDAVDRIETVLADADRATRLRDSLPDIEQRFGRVRFRERFRETVNTVLASDR